MSKKHHEKRVKTETLISSHLEAINIHEDISDWFRKTSRNFYNEIKKHHNMYLEEPINYH